MTKTDKTRKILWGRSGGVCAICQYPLVIDRTAESPESIVGIECHIIAQSSEGPRGDRTLPSEMMDEVDNLILLCATHHKMVDDQHQTYSVSFLRKRKVDHENWVASQLSRPNLSPTQMRDEIANLIKRRQAASPQERLALALDKLNKAENHKKRFYALRKAAKESFQVGQIEEARKYAEELSRVMPAFDEDWNYGNAVHDVNLVLGRIALREGRNDDAKQYLIESGKSPGSPQMNSFGPNMSLAADLVEKGECETVLEYFKLCSSFWESNRGRLKKWSEDVKAGRIPDFGPNLLY